MVLALIERLKATPKWAIIMAYNYRRTQNRKAKKGHGRAKFEKT